MNAPVIIRDGQAHPITAAQWALARAHKPIGAVAGLSGTKPPVAVAPTATAAPEPAKLDGRALSRASMLKQIGAKYGEDARTSAEVSATAASRRSGLDPKAAPNTESPPVESETMSAEASRAYGRKSMLAMVERRYGKAARAQAEARIAARGR